MTLYHTMPRTGGPGFDYTYYTTYTTIVSAIMGCLGIVLFQAAMGDWSFRHLFWVTTVVQVISLLPSLLGSLAPGLLGSFPPSRLPVVQCGSNSCVPLSGTIFFSTAHTALPFSLFPFPSPTSLSLPPLRLSLSPPLLSQQVAASAFDLILVSRLNKAAGVSDQLLYLLGDAVVGPAILWFSAMPGLVLTSKLVPAGLEATVRHKPRACVRQL